MSGRSGSLENSEELNFDEFVKITLELERKFEADLLAQNARTHEFDQQS